MRRKLIVTVFSAIALFITVPSCKKESNADENKNEPKISLYNNNESHNMGQNCMNCHKQNGSGDGLFNAAGTVYDSLKTSTFPNATIKLFTGPNGTGTLKYTLQVDAKGNFYTTDIIDFGTGLYPAAQGSSTTKFMSSVILQGQCNGCHGVSTDKIWTK